MGGKPRVLFWLGLRPEVCLGSWLRVDAVAGIMGSSDQGLCGWGGGGGGSWTTRQESYNKVQHSSTLATRTLLPLNGFVALPTRTITSAVEASSTPHVISKTCCYFRASSRF
jgi:hypothetical protein